MFYTSMIKNKTIKEKIKEHIARNHSFQVGLGTIARGILGDEPILSPKELEKDLDFLHRKKIKRAVIFRLGGLNKEYMKKIKIFTGHQRL